MADWNHLDFIEPPAKTVVIVYDENLNEQFFATWRSDGWLYDTLLKPSPDNKWWTFKPCSEKLRKQSIEEHCNYKKK